MKRSFAAVPLLALTVLAAACRPSADDAAAPPAPSVDAGADAPSRPPTAPPPADDGVRSGTPETIAMPPADTPTPPLAGGAVIAYTCEDGGDLRVVFGAGGAEVAMPDGSIATLPLSPQASAAAAGEVFIGEGVALQRLGNVVELQHGDGSTRRCRETAGSA